MNRQEITVNGLTIELCGETLALASLRCGEAVWVDCLNNPAGASLWQVLLADAEGRRSELTSADAASASVSVASSGVTTLAWRDVRGREVREKEVRTDPVDVTVTIAPGDAPGATLWRIHVENRAPGWTLWQVVFPRIAVVPGGDGAADEFYYPDGWGRRVTGLANMTDMNRRASRGWDWGMQLVAYARPDATLYLATHDETCSPKSFHLAKRDLAAAPNESADTAAANTQRVELAVTHFPENMTVGGNNFASPYPVALASLTGDWFDACQRYAAWARRQPWAVTPAFATTPDAAPNRAAREVHCWHVLHVHGKPVETHLAQMQQLANGLDIPLAAQIYDWHQVPFDVSYPDYFPIRPETLPILAGLKKIGIRALPYINGRLWDINAASWTQREAERFCVKYSAQRANPRTLFPYLEEYGSGQKLSPMCPATDFWRATVVDLCRRITGELGCDGVYIDQVAAEKAELCFARDHGHAPGGGRFWLDGYRKMLREIRQAVGNDVLLTTECNWEACLADYDALLSWAWFTPEAEVPMFPAVYSGLGQSFGCVWSKDDVLQREGRVFAHKQARLLAWGAQLGWGDLTLLLDEPRRPLLDFMRRLCALRREHVQTFALGRMLRPPTVAADSAATDEPPVQAGLWQSADGSRRQLFVVNPSPLPRQVTLQFDSQSVTVELHPFHAEARDV
ncbi:MAG: DUF6259 domain-containing protein [Phycisphaerae bacterium]|nr:DUF6259 domain-containing protein [Phycisphaerae bacterium]